MGAGARAAGRGRCARSRFAALALGVYALAALVATWPGVRHVDDGYLARPAAGHGEAAAGDHLQLGWAFWLVGHQLGRGDAPWVDPYSFRPEAEAPPNVQGWLLAVPYWPLDGLLGDVWAYNLVVLLSFVAAGGTTCWWLRALGLGRGASLAGGLVFALAPYRVGQTTGHLLGLVSFLLPAVLLALERRRWWWACAALVAIPLSGQLHLTLGAIVLCLGYGWARLRRGERRWAVAAASGAAVAGVIVQQAVVAGSIASGRSFAQVERYSAELSDFARRGVGAGIEELVFVGWLTPLLAIAGLLVVRRRQRGLAWLLALAVVVPALLALGANLPGYEQLWKALPPLHATRVPERFLPIACLALAALVAFALDRLRGPGWIAVALVVLAADLHVAVFGAVEPDERSGAYAAVAGDGSLLELPVVRPDLHYGSVYLAYARQSPRERPQGYATTAPPAADRWARAHRGLSCGRGRIPPYIRFVAVHRGVYRQSGFFAGACPGRAEASLRAQGLRLAARDGAIAMWARR
jgi:Predicted membrane protein (DUF2079)